MRRFALLIILLASCKTSIGDTQEGTVDARPIDFRETPKQKEGSATALGCDGVTVRGSCEKGKLVFCDLEKGRKRNRDCAALGEECILDVSRGADCKSSEPETGPSAGATSPCPSVSEIGFCSSAGVAIWCDTTGAEPIRKEMDCGAENKTCAVGQEGCATGAFCCGGDDEPAPTDCGTVDFAGSCEGDTAIWCSGFGTLQTRDCAAENRRCEEDVCATGAFCCGLTSTATPEQLECAALGWDGTCNADNTVASYCDFYDVVQHESCTGTEVCGLNTPCGAGATCCDPTIPTNECTTIGSGGVCADANTIRVCDGTDDTDIFELSCNPGTTCQADETGANCREPVDPCADLDFFGRCDGDTLEYCVGSNYNPIDCIARGQTCEENTCAPGYASCCD